MVLFNTVLSFEANTLTLRLSYNDYIDFEYENYHKLRSSVLAEMNYNIDAYTEVYYCHDLNTIGDITVQYQFPVFNRFELGFVSQAKFFTEELKTETWEWTTDFSSCSITEEEVIYNKLRYYMFFQGRFISIISEHSRIYLQIPIRYFPDFGYWDPLGSLLREEETVYYEHEKKHLSYHVGLALDFAILIKIKYFLRFNIGLNYETELRHKEAEQFFITYHRFGLLYKINQLIFKLFFNNYTKGSSPYRIGMNFEVIFK